MAETRIRIAKHAQDVPETTSYIPVGTPVRIRLVWDRNEKRGENWSKEVYRVVRRVSPRSPHRAPHYVFEGLKGIYYRNDLQPVVEPTTLVRAEVRYEVSKLLKNRTENGKIEYLVLWKGYKEPTWEPRAQLTKDVPKMVKAFEKGAR